MSGTLLGAGYSSENKLLFFELTLELVCERVDQCMLYLVGD